MTKKTKSVDALFEEIEQKFELIGAAHKEELEEAWIKPIHESFPFAQNGITCLIASMGSGKSYNYIKMACKQEVVGSNGNPFFELVVICSTSAKFDRTVETYKHLITKSKLVCVQDTILLDWLNKYMRRILKYNALNDYIKSGVINDECMRIFLKHSMMGHENDPSPKGPNAVVITEDHQNKPVLGFDVTAKGKVGGIIITSSDKSEVIPLNTDSKGGVIDLTQTHRVQYAQQRSLMQSNKSEVDIKNKRLKYIANKLAKYGWKTMPHRCLLILDDFASHPLLRSKETEMSRLLKKLRHFNINVIICVQTVKSISKDIKRTLSDIVLFPGVSYDDFMDLMKESPAGVFDRKKLYEEYLKLKSPHDMFTIHIKANKVVVTESKL